MLCPSYRARHPLPARTDVVPPSYLCAELFPLSLGARFTVIITKHHLVLQLCKALFGRNYNLISDYSQIILGLLLWRSATHV
jgi:hypothetical protein